jgi:hypothetical protein
MSKSTHHNKQILVYADWIDLGSIMLMGTLQVGQVRGKEVFSFSYTKEWLEKGPALIIILEPIRRRSFSIFRSAVIAFWLYTFN